MRSRAVSHEMPGSARPSSAQNSCRSRRPSGSKKPRTPTAPRELADQPSTSALGQPVDMAADLVGPGGDLEAEGDRRSGLTVGSTHHRGVAMPLGEVEQRILDRTQVAPDDPAHPAHHQGEPRVGDVLHGRAQVDVLACGLRQYPLQRADQAERRMRGETGLLGDVVEIEPGGVGVLRDQLGGFGRDDAEPRLRRRQRAEDVEPVLQPGRFVEGVRQLRRRKQVAVLPRVGQAGAHAGSHDSARAISASVIWPSDAPHGHRDLAVVDHDAVLEQTAFRQQRTGNRRAGARADVDLVGSLAVEPFVDLLRTLAADERPGLVRWTLVQIGGLRTGRVEAAAPARHEVPLGRRVRGQIGQAHHVRHELHRRQRLGHVEHALRLVEQLCRLRRRDLANRDPQRRRVDDEVDVFVASLHDGGPHTRGSGESRGGQRGRHAGVDVRAMQIDTFVGAGQQLDLGDRREQRLLVLLSDPDDRRAITIAHNDEPRAPVGLPADEMPDE